MRDRYKQCETETALEAQTPIGLLTCMGHYGRAGERKHEDTGVMILHNVSVASSVQVYVAR